MLILLAVLTDMTGNTSAATGIGNRSIRALHGKALGGSSAVNAAVAIRARATDFAKWSALGIQGWSFDEVLTSYKAVENSPHGEDQYRGRSGPRWDCCHGERAQLDIVIDGCFAEFRVR